MELDIVKVVKNSMNEVLQHEGIEGKIFLNKSIEKCAIKSYTKFIYEIWYKKLKKDIILLHKYSIQLPNAQIEKADYMFQNELLLLLWKGILQKKLL